MEEGKCLGAVLGSVPNSRPSPAGAHGEGGRREGCAAAPGPGGMLREASERPRGEDRGEKGAEKGRTGGLRLRRAGPGGGEAAAALKARYQWVSLQDKQRPDPGAAGAVLGPSPGGPGMRTGTGTGPHRGRPGPRLRGSALLGSQHQVLGRCGAARQLLLQSGFVVSAAFLDPSWSSSSSAWAWVQRARLAATQVAK